MGLVQLNAPGDFHAATEKRWDLRDPDGLEPVDVDVIVSRTPADFYRICPTVTVSVNADGATVRRRLPVPLSPVIRTVASVSATRLASTTTRSTAGEL